MFLTWSLAAIMLTKILAALCAVLFAIIGVQAFKLERNKIEIGNLNVDLKQLRTDNRNYQEDLSFLRWNIESTNKKLNEINRQTEERLKAAEKELIKARKESADLTRDAAELFSNQRPVNVTACEAAEALLRKEMGL